MSNKITASFKSGSNEVTGVPVVNPGNWFGKAWCLDYGRGPVIVEANTCQDAIDELVESDQGMGLRINDSERGDYGFECGPGDIIGGVEITEPCWMNLKGEQITDPVKGRQLANPSTTGGGIDYDMDNLHIVGEEGKKCPFKCLYHGEGIPEGGLTPIQFGLWGDMDDAVKAFVMALPGGLRHPRRHEQLELVVEAWEAAFAEGKSAGFENAMTFVDKEYGHPRHLLDLIREAHGVLSVSPRMKDLALAERCEAFVNAARTYRDPRCHIVWNMEGDVRVPTFTWHNEYGRNEAKNIEDCAPYTRFTFERLLAEESK